MTRRPIESVLVANRGEIAVRVIDACHRLGLHAVAVYSDADRDALHVARADAAMRLGPAPARDSYLNARALLDAAARAGADAVHPGYGFLAENAGFARDCADAGLVFIGPHAEAIASMGAKHTAKAVAERAGVPTVPGCRVDGQDQAGLADEARRIGFPLLVKASAGGGGRGMRRVDDAGALADALALARAEADAAFGDATLLLERFVPRARHLEVQVLGDRHGNVVHLLERDCSVQRNHQKLIEEAPAPGVPDALRRDIRRWAVALAKAIDYDSAGTVEFVHDPEAGRAWFLEMNTRLQVEHPVTEAVTGVDLVTWQIRIASGEALDLEQADIAADGWAMEARVAAEDPAAGYAPQTGVLHRWRVPAGPGLRVDAGVGAGDTISHNYDSLLAKVIAHGRDREQARRRLRRALGELEAVGVTLNTGFLRDLIALPAFVAARHHTAVIDETWPEGWKRPPAEPRCRVEAALAAHLASGEGQDGNRPWAALGAWRITEPAGRRGSATHYVRADDGATSSVQLAGRRGRYGAVVDGADPVEIRGATLAGDRLVYETGDVRHEVRVDMDDARITLLRPAGNVAFEVLAPEDALLDAAAAAGPEGSITAPMPGAVVEVRVRPGDPVRAGQTVCVLEAMKLYQELTARFDGVVVDIRCQAGDNVAGDELLAVIEPEASPTAADHEDRP